ncbi:carbohydrate porin [Halocella sp. SP3-1]|uniref:carbohydrate porin n=1 Tax=Halocella sp. SP3-1 TaxID=2382161 RepID=UPI000F755896|nr:carbohydrate porin [Halocella sp. SP3-1]AZO93171.1 hypothetical protein D7D81_00350 [Halocella sp. SP3-1]
MKKIIYLVFVVLVIGLLVVPVNAQTTIKSVGEGQVEVAFTYAGYLNSDKVYVAGEFNDWNKNDPEWRMKKKDGIWSLTKVVAEGEYQYKFTVFTSGIVSWVLDEDASSFAPDGYGGQNSVLIADANVTFGPRIIALEKQMASVNQGFEYHGYARSGYMVSSNGGAASNQLPSSFRLGNEIDTYVENTFAKTFSSDNGSWMKASFMLVNKNVEHSTWTTTEGSWEDDGLLRQAYVEGSGFDFAPHINFWAGKKYYGRSDVHISDFYWRDYSGYGAGIDNVNCGKGKFGMAYIGHSGYEGDYFDGVGEYSQHNIDFRFTELPVPGGNMEFELTYAYAKGDDEDIDNLSDGGLAVIYNRNDFYGATDGTTTTAVQFGTGILAGDGLGSSYATWMFEDARSVRFLTYGVANVSDKVDIMPQLVYQSDRNKYGEDEDISSIALGARLVHYITNNFSMQYEYGVDRVEQEFSWNSDEYTVHKITIAPTIKLDSTFWNRPELRFFVTYATGDEEADWASEYEEDSGLAYGVQMETWW